MKEASQKDSATDRMQAVERLIAYKYFNPYDVLQLGGEATEPEIKKKYRAVSMLVHPDKNSHP
jgi:DnaJ-class molecular chaperone